MIDWRAIEDRTRFLRKNSAWGSPQSILKSAKESYHRDLWANQSIRFEVWIEKDALVGVIDETCKELDVPFFSCRGYVSDSEMWSASLRHDRYAQDGQNIIVLHLGDHDPSGIDMSRDIQARLDLFCREAMPSVERIALTMQQVEEQSPPPNPAKVTDSRYEGYRGQYGDDSWELDALEPAYIINLIKESVLEERNADLWEAAVEEQEQEREQIQDVIDRWEELF
jgi:hypothetical protein